MSGRGRGRRRERWGDNGFEAWGGYMAAKKAKLEEQFSDDVKRKDGDDDSQSGIFSGVAIFVNGYTSVFLPAYSSPRFVEIELILQIPQETI